MNCHSLISVGASLVLAAAACAGPLNPPAGPIAPSNKTLNEVEPSTPVDQTNTPGDASATFKITKPGAYHLVGNLSGDFSKPVIAIIASDVLLDLRGFKIAGISNGGVGITTFGVTATDQKRIRVVNGSITGCRRGVSLLGAGANCVVADVSVGGLDGSVDGVNVGETSLVSRCTVSGVSTYGCQAGAGSRVQDCVFDGCFTGVQAFPDVAVQRCAILNNGTGHAIFANPNCLITDCVISQGQGSGIRLVNGGIVDRCILEFLDGDGITSGGIVRNSILRDIGLDGIRNTRLVENCTLLNIGQDAIEAGIARNCDVAGATKIGIAVTELAEGCNVESCEFGITTLLGGEGARVVDCRINGADGNALELDVDAEAVGCIVRNATAVGITGNGDNRIEQCAVMGAGLFGIAVNDGATIRDCRIEGAGIQGVFVSNDALVEGVTVTDSGAEGIIGLDTVRVIGCSIFSPLGDGIELGSNFLVKDCLINEANGTGITAGTDGIIESCVISDVSTTGIRVTSDVTITGCTVQDSGTGIEVNNVANVDRCTIKSCRGDGIDVGESSLVSNCILNNIRDHGIVLARGSTAKDNRMDFVSVGPAMLDGAGIEIVGTQCRVQGNEISRCDNGIRSNAGRCLIVQNAITDQSLTAIVTGPGDLSGPTLVEPNFANFLDYVWANFVY